MELVFIPIASICMHACILLRFFLAYSWTKTAFDVIDISKGFLLTIISDVILYSLLLLQPV